MSRLYKEYLKEGMIKNFFDKVDLRFARNTFIDLCNRGLLDCNKIKFGEYLHIDDLIKINHYQPTLDYETKEVISLYNEYIKRKKPKKVWIEKTEDSNLPSLTESEKLELTNLIREYNEII